MSSTIKVEMDIDEKGTSCEVQVLNENHGNNLVKQGFTHTTEKRIHAILVVNVFFSCVTLEGTPGCSLRRDTIYMWASTRGNLLLGFANNIRTV